MILNVTEISNKEDMIKMLDLANKFNSDLTELINPEDYKNPEEFINLIITALTIPASSLVFRLSKMYDEKYMSIVGVAFIEKFQLGLKWAEHKDKTGS